MIFQTLYNKVAEILHHRQSVACAVDYTRAKCTQVIIEIMGGNAWLGEGLHVL